MGADSGGSRVSDPTPGDVRRQFHLDDGPGRLARRGAAGLLARLAHRDERPPGGPLAAAGERGPCQGQSARLLRSRGSESGAQSGMPRQADSPWGALSWSPKGLKGMLKTCYDHGT